MTDENDRLSEAAWATEILSADEFAEMQHVGEAIANQREAFVLYIFRDVRDTVELVENYASIWKGYGSDEQADYCNEFFHELIAEFYAMCVKNGVLQPEFWKEHTGEV